MGLWLGLGLKLTSFAVKEAGDEGCAHNYANVCAPSRMRIRIGFKRLGTSFAFVAVGHGKWAQVPAGGIISTLNSKGAVEACLKCWRFCSGTAQVLFIMRYLKFAHVLSYYYWISLPKSQQHEQQQQLRLAREGDSKQLKTTSWGSLYELLAALFSRKLQSQSRPKTREK